MVLVDTSVWIDYLRKSDPKLVALLEAEQVVTHPFVIGELACGNLNKRDTILTLLATLPHASRVEDDELLIFIDRHQLAGRGLGLIDMHLLASAVLDQRMIWTKDKQLASVARQLACSPK